MVIKFRYQQNSKDKKQSAVILVLFSLPNILILLSFCIQAIMIRCFKKKHVSLKQYTVGNEFHCL